jgi:tetratricopeptide (TPR) repeat protein
MAAGEDQATELKAAIEAARKAPHDAARWDRVEELLDQTQTPDAVSELYQQVLAATEDAELATDVGQRGVRFYESWYGEDHAGLPTLLTRVLELDPNADWAFARLAVAYTVGERWTELLAAYDRAIESADQTARRMQLLEEAAQTAKDFAGEPDLAIGYLNKLFALDPSNASLAASLERLLERQARWEDLIALWEARMQVLSDKQERETRVRMASTLLDKLGRPADALVQAKLVLETAADYKAAHDVLEQVLGASGANAEQRREALALLKAHYEKKKKPAEVVRVLGVSLAFAAGQERVATLRELVERLVDAGEEAEAMRHQAALLLLEPMPSERDTLRALAERTRDYAAYAAALVAAADADAPAQIATDLRMEAARIQEDELSDPAAAIALYQRVFGGEAARELLVQAGRKLIKLLEGTEREPETLEVLGRMSDLEPEESLRKAILGKVARLAEKLGDVDRARQAWQARVGTNTDDVEALDALISSARGAQDWPALIAHLQKRIAAPGAAERRREDMVWLAKIFDEKLGSLDAAIEIWQTILTGFGEDMETVSALTQLYSRAERWQELAKVLNQAARHEVARFTELQTRLGDAYRERLGEPERAVNCYRSALQVDPTNAQARAGQTALLDSETCRAEALDSLAEAYQSTDEWQQTLALLEARLELAEGTQCAEILIEAAELHEQRSGDVAQALACYSRAFTYIPDDRAAEREIRRLAEQLGNWNAVVLAYRETIASFERPTPRVAELRRDEGRMLEERLGDREGALTAYQAAAAIAPERLELAQEAVRLSAQLGYWEIAAGVALACMSRRERLEPSLIGLLEAAATAPEAALKLGAALSAVLETGAEGLGPAHVRSLHVQIARWYEERCGDSARAIEALLSACTADPGHEPTLRTLAGLQRKKPSAALVQSLLELAELDRGNLDARLDAAQAALGVLDDPAAVNDVVQSLYDLAALMFKQQRAASGKHSAEHCLRWALDLLAQRYLDGGAERRALELLSEAALMPFDRDTVQAYRHQAAQIADQRLHDSLRAIALYRDVLQVDGRDEAARNRLAALYQAGDRLPELLMLRRLELEHVKDPARRLELRLEVSRILGEMEAREGRVQSLEANLEELPGHAPTIEALATLLGDRGQYAELGAILGGQARRLGRDGQRTQAAELWRRAAELYRVQLRDADSAIRAYESLHELDPLGTASEALARLYSERGQHGRAAEWLELRLGTAPPETRSVTAVELARAHIEARQQERARGCLEQALAQDPRNDEARTLLAELYRTGGAYAELAALLLSGAEHVSDAKRKLAYLREAAEIHYVKLASPARAIPALRQALAMTPGDQGLAVKLAEGLALAGEHAEAATVLEKLIEDFGRKRSPERAELHYRLGRVLEAAGRIEEAFGELEAATKMDLSHVDSVHALARLSRGQGQLERAERAYRAMLMLVRRQAPGGDQAVGASEVFYELHGIATERGEADAAAELLQSALESATQSDAEARRFQRVLRERGDVELLMRVLDARLSLGPEPALEAEILGVRAEVLVGLDKKSEALDDLLKALGLDPDSDALHAQTLALARAEDAMQRYADALTSLAEKAGRKKAKKNRLQSSQLSLRLGRVVEQELEDLDRAAGIYAKVEMAGECVVEAWLATARIAGARGEHAEKRRVLLRISELGDDAATQAQRNDALCLLAEMELAEAATRDAGVATLLRALEHEPDYARATRILEQSLAKAPDHAGLLDLYAQVARECHDDRMLLTWHERVAALPSSGLEVIRHGIDLALRIGELARAEAMLQRAAGLARKLREDRQQATWVFSGLAECRIQANDFEGAMGFLREAMDFADADERRELQRELAELAAGPGGDLEVAAVSYGTLLAEEPGERAIWAPLLEVLIKIGNKNRLQGFVSDVLEGAVLAEDRSHVRMRYARFLSEHGAQRDAAPILRELLEDEPGQLEATDILMSIYQGQGMRAELAQLLGEQFDRARDQRDLAAIAELGVRLGDMHGDAHPDQALDVLRAALEWVPEHRGLLVALLARLGPEAEARDRAEVMHSLLKSETGDAAARLALELAGLWRQLGEDDRLQQALERGYAACPSAEAVLGQLEAFYAERELWRPLAELMQAEAARLGAVTEAVARLKNAALLFREQLGDLEAGAEALRAALRVVPDDLSLLGELARNLAAAGQHDTAIADVTRMLAEHTAADHVRVDLLRVRADLLLGVGRVEEGCADLEAAYKISPNELASRLVEGLEMLQTHSFTSGSQATERAATLRLVQVLDRMSAPERARDVLADWVERTPTDVAALRNLCERDLASERWEAVANVCEKLIDVEEGDLRAQAAVRLAEACESAGRPEDARMGLERVHNSQPDNREVLARLRRLYELTGAHRELASVLMSDAGLAKDTTQRLELLQRAAQLYVDMDDPEAALGPLEQARQLDPEGKTTLLIMGDILIKLGRLREAETMLDEAIQNEKRKRTPELALFQQRMGRVCGASGDRDGQLRWLAQAIDTDRRSGAIAAEMAEVAMQIQDYDAAMKALRNITMMEDPGPMSRAMAFLKQAQIAALRGDPRRAQHWARKAKSLDENLTEADVFLAEIGG